MEFQSLGGACFGWVRRPKWVFVAFCSQTNALDEHVCRIGSHSERQVCPHTVTPALFKLEQGALVPKCSLLQREPVCLFKALYVCVVCLSLSLKLTSSASCSFFSLSLSRMRSLILWQGWEVHSDWSRSCGWAACWKLSGQAPLTKEEPLPPPLVQEISAAKDRHTVSAVEKWRSESANVCDPQ